MYLVGGAVRDAVRAAGARGLTIEAGVRSPQLGELAEEISGADLDFIICGMEFDALTARLGALGKCDYVGKSFGVVKFSPDSDCEFLGWRFKARRTYDVALPRTERSTGAHHRDFEVQYDPALPIETDLMRRDFTINAMALSHDGALIDPAGGMRDLEDKTLRTVFARSFLDDPLRVLRAAQFAARFSLDLDPALAADARRVSLADVSAERIRDELLKGLTLAGKPSMFFRHLQHMGQLLPAFPELGAISAYWDALYAALDRANSAHRADALFWFLDRTDAEIAWFAERGFGAISRSPIPDAGAVSRAGMTIAGADSRSLPGDYDCGAEIGGGVSAAQKSAGRALFERIRFSNHDIARATTLSTYSLRIPETGIRAAAAAKSAETASSSTPAASSSTSTGSSSANSHDDLRNIVAAIRWTLKNVYDEGVAPADFLLFCRGLLPAMYDAHCGDTTTGALWEAEVAHVLRYIENPPLTGKRLLEMGYAPGVLFGEILEAVSQAHDRGDVATAEDAEAFVRRNFAR